MAKYRYPGSASFETSDKDIFFGRTQETAQFVDLLKVERLIVLYAKSGMGKTSLVNAGVIPELDRQGGFKYWRIRLQSYISQEKSVAPTLNLEKTLTQEATPDNAISRLNMPPQEQLWQYLRAIQYERQLRNEPLSMVLFFDQFEELFTYPTQQQQEFKEAIAQLLRSEAPETLKKTAFPSTDSEQIAQLFAPLDIKLVFIIRADRMSLMDSMKDHLPYILHTTYEMKPLSRKQARQAIEEPAKKAGEFDSLPFRYDLKTLETILNYLSVSEQDKKPIPIESFQLQIICESAEQAILKQKGKESVQPEDLGDLDNIFEKYYYHKLSELNAKPAENIRLRKLIEEELVVEGRRLSLDTTFCQRRADQTLLERLVEKRLLREEPNSVGGLSYELSHDTLIDPIEKARKERQEIEREEARKKRIKRIASIIAVVFVGLSIIIASLSYLYVEAEKAKKEAITLLEENQRQDSVNRIEKYNRFLAEARGLQANEEYSKAIERYQFAKEFAKDTTEIGKAIADCQREATYQVQFDTWLREAEKYAQAENYPQSLQAYQEAARLEVRTALLREKLKDLQRSIEDKAAQEKNAAEALAFDRAKAAQYRANEQKLNTYKTQIINILNQLPQ